jgi:hypothetical protein
MKSRMFLKTIEKSCSANIIYQIKNIPQTIKKLCSANIIYRIKNIPQNNREIMFNKHNISNQEYSILRYLTPSIIKIQPKNTAYAFCSHYNWEEKTTCIPIQKFRPHYATSEFGYTSNLPTLSSARTLV